MVADLSRSIRAVTRGFRIRPQPRYSPGLPLGHLFPTMARRLTMTNCVCVPNKLSVGEKFFCVLREETRTHEINSFHREL